MAIPAATLPLPSFIFNFFIQRKIVRRPIRSSKRLHSQTLFQLVGLAFPCFNPRPPASHVFAINVVLGAELAAQRWLFIKQDKQMESQNDEYAILQHLDAAEEQ